MYRREPRILCVGMICVDELLYCENYPLEDTDQRIIDRRLRTGGNAANNCAVLSQMNVKCELFGTLSNNSRYTSFIKEDLKAYGVDYDICEFIEEAEIPVSTCIINTLTGSRTILHYRKDWTEPSYESFLKINLSGFSWAHFEGRNINEVKKMIQRIYDWNDECAEHKKIRISIELEKKREKLLELIHLGDLIIISKDLAKLQGYNTMLDALDGMYKLMKEGAILVVPWGEEGAAARGPNGVFRSPAFVPSRVLDTLGAGDTFCAALVASLSRDYSLGEALRCACRVAGVKVSIHGYRGLKQALLQRGVWPKDYS